ncbi:MAG: helix-turn-helix transcriptional regulator [Acidimicrobiia bacterium]
MTRRVKGPATTELKNDILALRKAAGLTQAQLATNVGVTRKTINTVERGHYVPSTVLALRLAVALDTAVENIFSLPATE